MHELKKSITYTGKVSIDYDLTDDAPFDAHLEVADDILQASALLEPFRGKKVRVHITEVDETDVDGAVGEDKEGEALDLFARGFAMLQEVDPTIPGLVTWPYGPHAQAYTRIEPTDITQVPQSRKIYAAARRLFDNRLGVEGNYSPYALRPYWAALGACLYGPLDSRVRELGPDTVVAQVVPRAPEDEKVNGRWLKVLSWETKQERREVHLISGERHFEDGYTHYTVKVSVPGVDGVFPITLASDGLLVALAAAHDAAHVDNLENTPERALADRLDQAKPETF